MVEKIEKETEFRKLTKTWVKAYWVLEFSILIKTNGEIKIILSRI